MATAQKMSRLTKSRAYGQRRFTCTGCGHTYQNAAMKPVSVLLGRKPDTGRCWQCYGGTKARAWRPEDAKQTPTKRRG